MAPLSSFKDRSNTLAVSWEEKTPWKSPWCWESVKARGEEDNRGWDGWTVSLKLPTFSTLIGLPFAPTSALFDKLHLPADWAFYLVWWYHLAVCLPLDSHQCWNGRTTLLYLKPLPTWHRKSPERSSNSLPLVRLLQPQPPDNFLPD